MGTRMRLAAMATTLALAAMSCGGDDGVGVRTLEEGGSGSGSGSGSASGSGSGSSSGSGSGSGSASGSED